MADNEDFHLMSSSPAIEAGVNLPELDRDYDDIPYYNPPSSGAFEGNDAILALDNMT